MTAVDPKRTFTEIFTGKNQVIRYLIILGLLAGCAESPVRIGMMNDEDLASVEIGNLCFAFAGYSKWDPKIKVELQRRNVFNKKEWQAIDDHKIFIGMSEQALQCSWPVPDSLDLDSARLVKEGPWGVRVVYQYGDNHGVIQYDLPGEWPKKVYVENGVVVAYQEAYAARENNCLSFFEKRKCFDFDRLTSSTVSDALMP